MRANTFSGDSRRTVRLNALGRVEGWLDRAEGALPMCGLITGASGAGKTVLATQLAQRATHRGFVTGIVDAYVGGPSPSSPQLARQLSIDDAGVKHDAAGAIRARIEELGREGQPVLIVVDDIDQLPAGDVRAFADFAVGPPAARFALVFTARSALNPTHEVLDKLLSRLRSAGQLEHLVLGPLSFDEVADTLTAYFPNEPIVPRFTRDLRSFTQANARLLFAVIEHIASLPTEARTQLLSSSQALSASAIPPSLVELKRAELAQISAAARETLEALAVFAAPASIDALSYLVGRHVDLIEMDVDELEGAGVVRVDSTRRRPTVTLDDQILRAVLSASCPTLRRRRLHGRAATLLQESEQACDESLKLVRADHYLHAPEALAEGRVSAIVTAAREQIAHGRYETARDLLFRLRAALDNAKAPRPAFRALMLSQSSPEPMDFRDEAFVLESLISRQEVSEADLHRAQSLRAARLHLTRGDDAQVRAAYAQLLGGDSLPDSLRVDLTYRLGRLDHLAGDPDAARARFDRLIIEGEEANDPRIQALARWAIGMVQADGGESEAAIQSFADALGLARQAHDLALIARSVSGIGTCVADARSVKKAMRWLRRGLRLADRSGDHITISSAAAGLAWTALAAGDWAEARESATLALQIDASVNHERAMRRTRPILTLLDALEGRQTSGEKAHVTDDQDAPTAVVPALMARFEQARLVNNLEAASAAIEQARDHLERHPGWNRLLLMEVLPRRALVTAEIGALADLRQTIGEMVQLRSVSDEARATWEPLELEMRGRLARVEGDLNAAAILSDQAAAGFEKVGQRWRQANALADTGLTLRNLGRDGEADVQLSMALDLFRAMGAARQVEDLTKALGKNASRLSRSAGAGVLTAREWHVALLASRGLTDREIAESLVISHRTVSSHMHRILSKVGLNTRSGLPAWIATHERERALAVGDADDL